MFEKILFATDGSAHAERTLEYVKDLAQKYGAEVIVFHAYHFVHEFVSPAETEKILERAASAAQAVVDKAVAALKEAGVSAKGIVDQGPAAEEILSLADREGVDLIALGSKGAGGVTGVLLGSVSQRVSTLAKVPVLIVH